MRIKPLCISAAVALALAGGTAFAQTAARISGAGTTASTSTGTAAASTTSGSTSTTGTTTTTRTTAGGCTGTNGSTCTASDTNTSGTTTGTGTVTTTSAQDTVAATSAPGTATAAGQTSNAGDTTTPARSGQGSNSVSSDPTASRPGAFDAGGAFGPQAVPATTNGQNGLVVGGEGFVPNGGSQQNVFVQPQGSASSATTSTPIFDQAAREGRAREARRRAQGNEPRVIGIAPNTNRDLTWQMPDDPIIRY